MSPVPAQTEHRRTLCPQGLLSECGCRRTYEYVAGLWGLIKIGISIGIGNRSFWGFGRPRGPGYPLERWGAKPLTFWRGLPGPLGRPDPPNERSPILIIIQISSRCSHEYDLSRGPPDPRTLSKPLVFEGLRQARPSEAGLACSRESGLYSTWWPFHRAKKHVFFRPARAPTWPEMGAPTGLKNTQHGRKWAPTGLNKPQHGRKWGP